MAKQAWLGDARICEAGWGDAGKDRHSVAGRGAAW